MHVTGVSYPVNLPPVYHNHYICCMRESSWAWYSLRCTFTLLWVLQSASWHLF